MYICVQAIFGRTIVYLERNVLFLKCSRSSYNDLTLKTSAQARPRSIDPKPLPYGSREVFDLEIQYLILDINPLPIFDLLPNLIPIQRTLGDLRFCPPL